MLISFIPTDKALIEKFKNSDEFKSLVENIDKDSKRIVDATTQYKIHSHIWTDFNGLLENYIMSMYSFNPLIVEGPNPIAKPIKQGRKVGKNEITVQTVNGASATILPMKLPILYDIDIANANDKSFVETSVKNATKKWQSGLTNQNLRLFEFTTDKAKSIFTVTLGPVTLGNAESFYPSKYIEKGNKNSLKISNVFYTNNKDKDIFDGLLLHEFGHVLSFLHEVKLPYNQIKPIPKIPIIGKKQFIGFPITYYDPDSIMKPDNLNDASPPGLIWKLSPKDKIGLNIIYQ